MVLLPGGRNWKLIGCCCLVAETGSRFGAVVWWQKLEADYVQKCSQYKYPMAKCFCCKYPSVNIQVIWSITSLHNVGNVHNLSSQGLHNVHNLSSQSPLTATKFQIKINKKFTKFTLKSIFALLGRTLSFKLVDTSQQTVKMAWTPEIWCRKMVFSGTFYCPICTKFGMVIAEMVLDVNPKGIVDILCSFSTTDQNVWAIIGEFDPFKVDTVDSWS